MAKSAAARIGAKEGYVKDSFSALLEESLGAARGLEGSVLTGTVIAIEDAPQPAASPAVSSAPVSTKTMVMREPPVIPPPQPETRPAPVQSQAPQHYAPELPAVDDAPKSKTGLIVGVALVVIIVIIVAIVAT